MKEQKRVIPFALPLIGDEERAAVQDVLSGHMLTHGPKCASFEKRFAEMVGVKHAVTTSSCTTALHLSLLALGVGPGDEVLVPAMTHVATAHVVEHCGARPIFVDVEPGTGNIDPNLVSAAISEKTKAVLIVHYLGLPCDMAAIQNAVGNLPIVEDCAVAIGGDYGGRHPGSIGKTGCFSFYPAKHMTTMEGGMLTTDDDAIVDLVRKQRAFGYDKGLGERAVPGIYDIIMLGYNFRMSEVQAAIGLGQMDRLSGFMDARRRNSRLLQQGLQDVDGLKHFPLAQGPATSACFCYNITLDPQSPVRRGDFIKALNEKGVGTSVHYPVALPFTTYYRNKYKPTIGQFPVARWIADYTVSLPCGPHLNADDTDYIIESVHTALNELRG